MKTPNGWPVLASDSPLLCKWNIPGTERHLILHNGSIGFVLVHNALWFDEEIERLDRQGEPWDEWGYANRVQRESVSIPSEHAAAAASDLNSTKHPRGVPVRDTFTDKQIRAIRHRLEFYDGVLEWGGNWPSHPGSTAKPDGMHFQVRGNMRDVERVARRLSRTPRGHRVLSANPGQRRIIFT